MPLYAGTNVFFATRGGVQDAARPGWSTLSWSDEAAGVNYRNAGRVFIPDDDADRVFMVTQHARRGHSAVVLRPTAPG